MTIKEWDDTIIKCEGVNIFHSALWAKVIVDTYNYKPVYICKFENKNLEALFPLMEIRSVLTGCRGVGLPFTDQCDPVFDSEEELCEFIKFAKNYGKKNHWKTFELRGFLSDKQEYAVYKQYLTHTLKLQNEEEMFSKFKSNIRRNIRKAIKNNVSVKINNEIEAVKEFYRLNCITRKRHGIPPQPFTFFLNIHRNILEKNKGIIVLAAHNNTVVAGAIFLGFNNVAIYKYGASDILYQSLRPNNLVIWEAIKWFSKNGYKEFTFGRTEEDNKGLLQFKRSWSTKEESILYYKYDLKRAEFIAGGKTIVPSYKLFQMLPGSILRIISRVLYRHIG